MIRSTESTLEDIWNEHRTWQEFKLILRKSLSSDSRRSTTPAEIVKTNWLDLPELCSLAAGGEPDRTTALATAWGLLYTSAHLMDAVEDHDNLPSWMMELGAGATINVATGLYASSGLALYEMIDEGVGPDVVLDIYRDFHQTILTMCSGQHLDLTGSYQDLETCWRIAKAKSGAMFALACSSGARIALGDSIRIEQFEKYGEHLGILVQILDDASDLNFDSQTDQVLTKLATSSIPINYTMKVLSSKKREEFRSHLENARNDLQAAMQAYFMIEEAGTRLYLKSKIQYHQQMAINSISAISPITAEIERLISYLDIASGIA